MDKKLAALSVVSLLGVLLLSWEIKKELNQQGERLKILTEDTRNSLVKLQSDVARIAKRTEPKPTKTVAIERPSRNPTEDVTGASARAVRRIASKNQCARACGTLIQCLAGAEICPGIGTSDTRSASLTCSKRCANNPSLKKMLLDKTDVQLKRHQTYHLP